MNRLYALIVCTGGLASAAGCGSPPAEATAAGRDEARAALDRTAGAPLPPPTAFRPAALPDDPVLDAHPTVQQAVNNSRALTESQSRIVTLYETAVRPALDRTRLVKAWDAPDADLPALAAAARGLREMGEEVVRADDAFKALADAHRRALDRAPPGYQVLAAHLREKAADQEFPLLRERYGMLAAHAEAQAARVAELRDGFRQLDREVTGAMRFTRATVDFLRDLELTLALAPAADAGELRGHYQDHLRLYVKAYSQFDLVFVKWAAAVGNRPLPPRPTDPPPVPSGDAPDRSVARAAGIDAEALTEEAAARFGDWFVRELRAARAAADAFGRRSGGRPVADLSPSLRADLDPLARRARLLNAIRPAAVDGRGDVVFTGPDVPAVGTYLAVVRDRGGEFVGVVRVGADMGRGRVAVTIARGAVRPGDLAIRPTTAESAAPTAPTGRGGTR